MQTHLLPLLMVAFALVFSSAVSAQPSTDQNLERLKYRYHINDIDGVGELIDPLCKQIVQGDADFDLAQQHLIVLAATKFYVQAGEHHLAVLPYLIGTQTQEAMEKESIKPLAEPLDAQFRRKHLPLVFFSINDRQICQSQLNAAIDQDVLIKSKLVMEYLKSSPEQLNKIQHAMLASITAAKANALPSDQEIMRLIEWFVTQKDEHRTLAHESLATAIEALQHLNRNDEAERLRAAFRHQFPDSRRLTR